MSSPNRSANVSWKWLIALACAALWGNEGAPPTAAAQAHGAEPEQGVLAPGLYLFQTRTRDGNCPDATRTGYVTSAVATMDGVPGACEMTMQLINSKYWPTWNLSVTAQGVITGTANRNGGKDAALGSSRFELKAKKDRFQGVGARSYTMEVDGHKKDCVLNYDALLKPLD